MRSHGMRSARAAARAVARVWRSWGNCVTAGDGAAGAGIAAYCACNSTTVRCALATPPLADRNIAAVSAETRTAPRQPATTGRGSGFLPAASSPGRRLIARTSVLDPQADRDGERAERALGLTELLRD